MSFCAELCTGVVVCPGQVAAPQQRRCPRHLLQTWRQKGLDDFPGTRRSRGFCLRPRWPARLQPALVARPYPLLHRGAHNVRPPWPAANWISGCPDPGVPFSWLWVVGHPRQQAGTRSLLGCPLAPGERAWLVPVPGQSQGWNRDLPAGRLPRAGDQLKARGPFLKPLAAAATACQVNPRQSPAQRRRGPQAVVVVGRCICGQPARWRQLQQHGES